MGSVVAAAHAARRLPDLSDVQVIIRTTYPGQAPQIVENQVTYPLTTTMLSVPGAKTVRGYSFFGDSSCTCCSRTAPTSYWARSRVLEYLNQVQARLPAGAEAVLGPDATGVGWIYQYALVDRSGRTISASCARSRIGSSSTSSRPCRTSPRWRPSAAWSSSIRSFWIRSACARTASVATQRHRSDRHERTRKPAARCSSLARRNTWCAPRGYLQSLDDFRNIPLATTDAGVPVRLGDVARIQLGPEMRRGIAELDGEGEVAGGVIVMRSGKNALETIEAVKAKLAELRPSLPHGVEIVPVYDRSALIERAVAQPEGEAHRGIRRRRPRLLRLPVPPALGVRRDRVVAARRAGRASS